LIWRSVVQCSAVQYLSGDIYLWFGYKLLLIVEYIVQYVVL